MSRFLFIIVMSAFSSSLFADIKVQIASDLPGVSAILSTSYQAQKDSFLCKKYSMENGHMIPKIYDIDEVIETRDLANISIPENLSKCDATMISNPSLEFKTSDTLFARDVVFSDGTTIRPISSEINLNKSVDDSFQIVECKKYKLSNNQSVLGCNGNVGVGPSNTVRIFLKLK